jgi:hypothetical protein
MYYCYPLLHAKTKQRKVIDEMEIFGKLTINGESVVVFLDL